MGARHKLNVGFINGGLILAAVIGTLAQSWGVFLVAAFLLIGLSIYAREIRPPGPSRRKGDGA